MTGTRFDIDKWKRSATLCTLLSKSDRTSFIPPYRWNAVPRLSVTDNLTHPQRLQTIVRSPRCLHRRRSRVMSAVRTEIGSIGRSFSEISCIPVDQSSRLVSRSFSSPYVLECVDLVTRLVLCIKLGCLPNLILMGNRRTGGRSQHRHA